MRPGRPASRPSVAAGVAVNPMPSITGPSSATRMVPQRSVGMRFATGGFATTLLKILGPCLRSRFPRDFAVSVLWVPCPPSAVPCGNSPTQHQAAPPLFWRRKGGFGAAFAKMLI